MRTGGMTKGLLGLIEGVLGLYTASESTSDEGSKDS